MIVSTMKDDVQKQVLVNAEYHNSDTNFLNPFADLVSFEKNPQYFSVGVVDIVNSTNITANLSLKDASLYYSIFLNSMADIVKRTDGRVIKNIGDSLLFSFQKYQDSSNSKKLDKILECGLNMIDARDAINERLLHFELPELNYRVSADYGCLLVADTKISFSKDLFGSPVNTCSKINRKTIPNTMVIGQNLQQHVKPNKKYHLEKINTYVLLAKKRYDIYKVERKVH